MRTRFLIAATLSIFFHFSHVFAQGLPDSIVNELNHLLRREELAKAIEKTEELLAAPSVLADTFSLCQVRSYRGRAFLKTNMLVAMLEMGTAYELSQTSAAVPDWLRAEAATFYGFSILYRQSNIERAKSLMMEGLRLNESAAHERPFGIGYSYYHLGVLYHASGNYRESIEYAKKGIELFQKDSATYVSSMAACYNLLGTALSEIGDDSGLGYVAHAQLLFEQFYGKKTHPNSHAIWYTMGLCHVRTKNFDAVIQYFDKAISDFKENYKMNNHLFLASAIAYKGVAHHAKKDYLLAHQLAEQAISIWKKSGGGPLNELASYYLESGRSLGALERYEEAKVKLDSALAIWGYKGDISGVKQDFLHLSGTFDVLTLYAELNYLLFIQNNNEVYLNTAISYGKAASAAFYAIRDSMLDDASILSITERSYTSLETLIQMFLLSDRKFPERQYKMEAFYLVERLKGFVLLKSRLRANAKAGAAEQNFLTVAEVQSKLLSPSQSMLEYFVGDSLIFVFVIGADYFDVVEIKKDFPLEKLVAEFRSGLTEYHFSDKKTPELRRSANQRYRQSARVLYDTLIAPIESKLRREIIVLPDGVLGYLPFEALLSSDDFDIFDYRSYPFLLKKHSVRYCYSASLLYEMSEKKHKNVPLATHTYAGFAPWYPGSRGALSEEFRAQYGAIRSVLTADSIPDLRYSGEEVLEVRNKFKGKGKTWIGTEATRKIFLDIASRYRILHLSTHGQADDRSDDYSFLMFAARRDGIENELVYIRDLYKLTLNADLVVLSACQTGLGRLRRGEGIISLARAFAYAGAKNIASTLWSVNDARTKDFMLEFYAHLLNGKEDMTEALYQAKMHFVQKDNSYADPYFWSGFILIGDGKKFDFD